MNEDAVKFMEKNGFDPILLEADLDSAFILRKPQHLNDVLSKSTAFYNPAESMEISIADIYGYDTCKGENIFESFEKYFESNGDTYHTRSIGLLDYSSDEIIKKIDRSFYSEPIKVAEVEKNKYVITVNGRHRFTVLRAHYLMELYKSIIPDEKELKEKYKIPVKCERLNTLKTYSVYILRQCGLKEGIRVDWDEYYRPTGLLEFVKSDGTKEKIDDTHLLKMTALAIENNPKIIRDIQARAYLSESFKEYVQNYFPQLLVENPREELENAVTRSW